MVLGAGLLGVFTTFLIEFFNKKAKLQADASIGVTFTWLFAIGVVLISLYAGKVDLDQDCVLYGEIAYTPLDTVFFQNDTIQIPKAVIVMSIVLAVVLLALGLFYKQLLITSFDPAFAAVIGLSVGVWHYVLMGLVSAATVASFESVGAILVVALLIVPPATAYLLTDNFKKMLVLACISGIAASVAGYYLAVLIDGSIAAAIATVSGLLFGIVFIFSPSHGLLRRRIIGALN